MKFKNNKILSTPCGIQPELWGLYSASFTEPVGMRSHLRLPGGDPLRPRRTRPPAQLLPRRRRRRDAPSARPVPPPHPGRAGQRLYGGPRWATAPKQVAPRVPPPRPAARARRLRG